MQEKNVNSRQTTKAHHVTSWREELVDETLQRQPADGPVFFVRQARIVQREDVSRQGVVCDLHDHIVVDSDETEQVIQSTNRWFSILCPEIRVAASTGGKSRILRLFVGPAQDFKCRQPIARASFCCSKKVRKLHLFSTEVAFMRSKFHLRAHLTAKDLTQPIFVCADMADSQDFPHFHCCDRKSRAECAQSFAPWQQAAIEIMRRDLSYYCLLALHI